MKPRPMRDGATALWFARRALCREIRATLIAAETGDASRAFFGVLAVAAVAHAVPSWEFDAAGFARRARAAVLRRIARRSAVADAA